MSVKLTTRENGNVTIVDVHGRLTLGEGTYALRRTMKEMLQGGTRWILLNMAGVTSIDSAGIGELVAAYAAVTAAGGEIKLLNLARHAHDLLEVTKLYTVFETFEDEAAAIGSFSAALTELQIRWARFMGQHTHQ